MMIRCKAVLIAVGVFAFPAWAFDPAAGDWSKTDPTDIRVMTWNVERNLDVSESKAEAYNSWTSIVAIVAGMKPDILLLQEPANGDNQSMVENTLRQMVEGGVGVGAYVQKYDPSFELPFIYVSANTDGFLRNAIMSRFPLKDLNGDTRARYDDIPFVLPDAYAPSGVGGIRGFMFVELDLPDEVYAGDLVVGNAHLKAFSGSGEHEQRVTAARNVAYFIDHFYNGAGQGVVDPNNKILESPVATDLLDDNTPVIIGGDWNEDETKSLGQYGEKGPARWLTEAAVPGGSSDGTDRDGSDMTYDDARTPRSGDRSTQSSSKLDYLGWQDSITTARHTWIFNTGDYGTSPQLLPPEVAAYPSLTGGLPAVLATGRASDHRPVLADFIMPLAPTTLCGDANCDGAVNSGDIDGFVTAVVSGQVAWEAVYGCDYLAANDTNGDGQVNSGDIDNFVSAAVNGACP